MKNKKKYSFLKFQKYNYQKYSIVPLRKKDMQLIRNWRNQQIDVLRQNKKLSTNDQIKYYNFLIKNSFFSKSPDMILFSFLLDGKCIGYGGFVHIDWNFKRSEISIITQTSRNKNLKTYKKDFEAFFKIIKKIAFEEIGFNRLFTETYDIRPYVIKLLKKVGFKIEGKMIKHVIIQDKYVNSLIHGCLKENYKK